jgi:hypothetical protein
MKQQSSALIAWIQSKCCCNAEDARECAALRDDFHPDDDEYMQRICECACHDEIAELEELE